MTDSDFFCELPSVARELVFRHTSIIDQRNIYRAYRSTPEFYAFNEIQKFKQPFSCWMCQLSIFLEKFWNVMIGFNTDGEGGYEYSALRCEPSHDTAAFNLLYKFQEKSHLKDVEVYSRRDFTTEDAKGADKVFDEFLEEIGDVFKAYNQNEMLEHMHFAHNEDAHIPPAFFKVFTTYQGKK